MQKLIENIVRELVDSPDEVVVARKAGSDTVLELKVAPGDLGRVIGKQGRTARSLRSILGASAAKHNTRCTLDILE
jgi:predicted RNA-binding protein YlqC (UPF0109 family)